MRIFLGLIDYSFTVVTLIISVVAAIYKPALGVITCLGLMALLLDKNKEVFRKFYVSPSIFLRRHMLVTGGHRAYFFAALLAVVVNSIAALVRL